MLSGGEKARVALAKLLLHPSNLLVLDEPTNHLDVTACEILEQALANFSGTLLFVSHDRSFINAIATRVVEVLPGNVRSFPGNYDDYQRKLATPQTVRAGRTPSTPGAAVPDGVLTTKAERITERQRRKSVDRFRRKIAASESEIQTAEEALEALGLRLGDPEVYKDGDRVRGIEAERSELQTRVDGLYRDWERLSAELEALEERD